MAQGALRGGREAQGPPAGRRRQVPCSPQVPASPHHMGWRGDQLLFQGKVPDGVARMVRQQPVSEPQGEKGIGRGHRIDYDTGVQLVQEPQAKGSGGRTERWVSGVRFTNYYCDVYLLIT